MTHTIGRLEIRYSGEVGIEGGGLLAVVYPAAECQASKAEHATNARRIVACVNACEGFATEVLEGANLHESAYAAEGREFELTKQRDTLLAALERTLHRPLTGNPSHAALVEYWQYEQEQGNGMAADQLFALAAIAAAKAGA
ncbi:hypothetical protein K32_48770 [Kaistia sp. 32K]|uniref:hypothetical protein n=1 Tax=Kaistia sp. 32K TaxID=2795690 RepID=UPI0019151A5E|nr:hypothetical protein [Kaistia sp. 32K]BCP56260.1 hypothetical protein K32_48770 [Kaistia sp. 32K]